MGAGFFGVPYHPGLGPPPGRRLGLAAAVRGLSLSGPVPIHRLKRRLLPAATGAGGRRRVGWWIRY